MRARSLLSASVKTAALSALCFSAFAVSSTGSSFAQTAATDAQNQSAPVVRRYVVDQAELLSVETEQRITEALARLHRQQDAQVVVVTVDDLQGEDITKFASQLGTHWGVAVNGDEPGMMVVVAPKEQKVKLHVGPGLEPWMPEQMTRHIIANYMFPSFSQANYEDGVINGAAGIIAILGQETPIGPKLQNNGMPQEAQVVRSSFTGELGSAETQTAGRDVGSTAANPARGDARAQATEMAKANGGMPSWLLFLLPLLVVVGAGAVFFGQRFAGSSKKTSAPIVAGEAGFVG